jgi:hypothetical protein
MPQSVKDLLTYLLEKIDSSDIQWDYELERALNLIIRRLKA